MDGILILNKEKNITSNKAIMKVRKILNINGLEKCKIIASNSLDEYIISDLVNQKACIDIFGVGERLITAKSEPVFGGVYKLVAVEEDGVIHPRIKISENIEKVWASFLL